MPNGTDSHMVSHITGKLVREEASRRTKTVDIARIIRGRRLEWVGHILRMDPQRMIHQAAKFITENRSEANGHVTTILKWKELKQLVANRDYLRLRVKTLTEGSEVRVDMR